MKLIIPRLRIVSMWLLAWAWYCTKVLPPAALGAEPANVIPISIHLPKAAYVTVVIEDAAGNRVRNLAAETYFGAGDNTIYWDGYNDGTRERSGDLLRHRVSAATYHVRGLTHEGIRLSYEMSVNTSGSPPWMTKDGSGGWLADHSPPADVLYLPKDVSPPNGNGTARFLVCSTSGEAGSEFVWLDAEGRRLFGDNDGFWGGTHLARDVGPNPLHDYYAYVFESGQRDPDNFNLEVRGFQAANGRFTSVLKFPRPHSLPTFVGDQAYGSDGLAVYDGRIVVAVTGLNKVIFADARTRKVTGEVELASPRAPAFDPDGRLFVISEGKVKRFRLPAGAAKLEDEQIIVGAGLEDPHRLVLDRSGNVCVSDWGKNHQIKVFSAQGEPIRAIGEPGGPQIGTYDEKRMAHPCGFSIDDAGRYWVAEGDLPKRISIWNNDGSFVRALYGPEKYGGGGALDPRDKSRFYYDENSTGLEFALDWETGTSKVKRVFWRPELSKKFDVMPGTAPERAIYVGSEEYLVNCYNGGLRYNTDRGAGIWHMGADGVAKPVAMIGNAADLVHHLWGWHLKNQDQIVKLWDGHRPQNVLFVWCDRNGDGIAQPDEIQWTDGNHSTGEGGPGLEPLVMPDLSFTTAYGLYVPPPKIDSNGVAIYDLAKRSSIGDLNKLRSPQFVADRLITHGGSWEGFDMKGEKRWQYPATPEEQIGGPGAMVAPTRILGPAVTPTEGQAGSLVAINGEMGAIFLITGDGLFIQTLGGDARLLPPISEPNPKRNDVLSNFTFQQEHFHPTINQTSDGKIYLVAGYQQGSILRLDGFDAVQRHDFGVLQVHEAQLAAIPATAVKSVRKRARPTGQIAILAHGPKIDGNLADWGADTTWMRIDERAAAAMAVDQNNLYVAFRTGDAGALDNAGRDPRYLFKSGGALDVMIGADPRARRDRSSPVAGDLRLLVTRSNGKPSAVIYRQSVPGAGGEQTVYQSPVGKVAFDEVRDISEHLAFAAAGGNFEYSVPLKALGLNPARGEEILADVGILRGAQGRTMQRAYWSNLNTTIVSDLPSEARLQPAEWGIVQFK